jgi:hypothetical protein
MSLTRQTEQYQPINHQDRPKHRQIENLKPARHKAADDHPGGAVPELELGQPADEGAKLLVLLGGEGAALAVARAAVLQALVLRQGRVKLGLQEGEEEIQQVDAQAVGDDVPALREEDAQEEGDEEEDGTGPAVGHVGGRGVEVGLVFLREKGGDQFEIVLRGLGADGEGLEGRNGLRASHGWFARSRRQRRWCRVLERPCWEVAFEDEMGGGRREEGG